MSSLDNIFTKFLYLLNASFDGGSSLDETEFLSKILKREDIIKILTRQDLNLKLRTELIKFYRMLYIDIIIDKNKEIFYNSLIIKPIIIESDFGDRLNNKDYYKLISEIVNVKDSSTYENLDYALFMFEFQNFTKFLENYNDLNDDKIWKYIEHGLILPSFVILNKFMTLLPKLKGNDFIFFYELVFHILILKRYLIEHKKIISKKPLLKKSLTTNTKSDKINSSLSFINLELIDQQYETLKEDIINISKSSFDVFNYDLMIKYLDKHFFSFVFRPISKSLKDYFSKESEKKIDFYSSNQLNEFDKKTQSILIYYNNLKINFQESVFVSTLSEINTNKNSLYRKQLFEFFLFLIKEENLSSKYQGEILYPLLKLLQYDTAHSQKELFDLVSRNMINFENLVNIVVDSLINMVFITCNPSAMSIDEDYLKSLNIIKILKYLCEEHNPNFQRILFNKIMFKFQINNNLSTLGFFEFMLTVVEKIIVFAKWDVNFETEEKSITYFYDFFFVIIELLIEMIQGTDKSNLETLIEKKEGFDSPILKLSLKYFMKILFNDKNNSPIFYEIRNDLLNFIMSFIEEKNCPEKLKKMISDIIKPNYVVRSMVNTMKKLYLIFKKSEDKNYEFEPKDFKKVYFDKSMINFFTGMFNTDDNFSSDNVEFKFSNRLFQYMKLISEDGNEEAKNIINMIKTISESEISAFYNKKNRDNYRGNEEYTLSDTLLEIYFSIKFFDDITSKVYVNVDNKTVIVIFTKNPKIKFLSVNTRKEFLENVSRENQATKLKGLIEVSEYFYDEIMYNYEKTKSFHLFKLLNSFQYIYLEIFMFILNLLLNIFLLSIYEKDYQDNKNTQSMVYIKYFEILLTLIHGLIIICWFSTKFFLYKKIDEKKYALLNNVEVDKLNNFQKIKIIISYSILSRNEVTMFIWNFVLGSIALSEIKFYWLFCIQLICVINLSTTLKNILFSITNRYKQLLLTFLCVVLANYEFSSIAFFYLSYREHCDFFTYEIETPEHHPGFIMENRCQSLIYCFLTHIDLGIRSDGGIGFFIPIVSFKKQSTDLIYELLYITLFFIIIVIILFAALLGIVIDTNTELNEESYEILKDKLDKCFICGGERNDIEKDGEKFEDHVNFEHDIYSYADYMIGFKFVDPQECNAVNSFVFDEYNNKSIAWIPKSKQKKEESNEEH